MTYNEFYSELYNKIIPNTPKHIRVGQAIMNYLHKIWPEKYKEILATDRDCFYDDKVIEKTLYYLAGTWPKNGITIK